MQALDLGTILQLPKDRRVWEDLHRLLVVVLLNAQPLYTGAKSSPGDRVLGEVEKDSFIALLGKGGNSKLVPSKSCIATWER